MNKSFIKSIPPFIFHANYYQFTPDEIKGSSRVESAMLLWCVAGKGSIVTAGVQREFNPNDFIFLPYEHSIRYLPHLKQPFKVAGIHFKTPRKGEKNTIDEVLHVAETKEERRVATRCAAKTPCHIEGRFEEHSPFVFLFRYLVELWQREPPSHDEIPALAQLMLREIDRYTPPHCAQVLPREAAQIKELLNRDGLKSCRVQDLAKHCQCSEVKLFRIFKKHYGTSLKEWLLTQKLQKAKEILSQSNDTQDAIAEQLGFSDAFHFSRFFKQKTGESPSVFRQKSKLF